MDTMKVAVFTGPGAIEIQTAPKPAPKPNQILMRIKACAICTWEQRVYSGIKKVEFPFVGGHEMTGVIEAIGSEIDPNCWKVGDTAAIGLMLACGSCHYCQIGEQGSCENFNHSKQLDGLPYHGMGGLSEYMLVRPEHLFKFNHISHEHATLTEPLSCVIHSTEMAQIKFSDTVLVIGCGIMGLFHTILSVKSGASVIACDLDDSRLKLASELGAHKVINSSNIDLDKQVRKLTNGRGADVIFDTTPISAVAKDALKSAGKLGKIVFYSSFYPDIPIDISPDWLHKNLIQLIGTANSNQTDFMKSAKMLSEGIVDAKPFISEVYPLDRVKEAFESAVKGDKFRVVVQL